VYVALDLKFTGFKNTRIQLNLIPQGA